MTKIVQKRTLYKSTNNIQMAKIHMGQLIKQVFEKSGYSTSELAALIHCDRTNIYRIFNRSSIDSELLYRISAALHYDFMQAYSPEKTTTKKSKVSFTVEIEGEEITIYGPPEINVLVKSLPDKE